MPLLDLLDLQAQGSKIGNIRFGDQALGSNGKAQPTKGTTLRFTSGNEYTIQKAAEMSGGTAKEWRHPETNVFMGYDVTTEARKVGVTIPPGEVLTQDYEFWPGKEMARRCNGRTMSVPDPGKPCVCPTDPIERAQRSVGRGADTCKPVTRGNLWLPQLPGLGYWRFSSTGRNAAIEVGGRLQLLTAARDRGLQLLAELSIQPRSVVVGGKTRNFVVPVLDILDTMESIVTGEIEAGAYRLPGGRTVPALPAGGSTPRSVPALTAAPPKRDAEDLVAMLAQALTADQVQEIADLAEEAGSLDTQVEFPPGSGDLRSIADYVALRRAKVGGGQTAAAR